VHGPRLHAGLRITAAIPITIHITIKDLISILGMQIVEKILDCTTLSSTIVCHVPMRAQGGRGVRIRFKEDDSAQASLLFLIIITWHYSQTKKADCKYT
jgi:hypothetical protein